MRLIAVLGVPILLLLGGAVYFAAKPSEGDRVAALIERADRAKAEAQAVDPEDAVDTEIVRKLLETKDLSEAQTTVLISAAGRRYLRRKQAYVLAKQAVDTGRAQASSLEPLQHEMDFARKVCDFAESLGHKHDLNAYASADAELERILAGGSGLVFGLTDRFIGSSAFSEADLRQLQTAFEQQFGRPLPISARGDSAAHRALGFDHRGRIDVAVSPLQPEGAWLRRYLTEKGVTFFAFSTAVKGKATGAHIHIGPPSARIGASASRRSD